MNILNCGLDPEIFVTHQNHIIPGELFVPAPKRNPNGILNAVSFDNAAVEMRPFHTTSTNTLVRTTKSLMKRATTWLDFAKERGEVPEGAKFTLAPASTLRDEDMDRESVSVFGCSPASILDADYYTYNVSPSVDPKEVATRSAGFHIHSELYDPLAIQPAVVVMDAILGLTDVIMNNRGGWIAESRMRRLELGYGRAGEHRSRIVATGKTVLEYRVMSPWPLGKTDEMVWAIDTMRKIAASTSDELMATASKLPSRSEIIEAINESSTKLATPLLASSFNAWDSTNAAQRLNLN